MTGTTNQYFSLSNKSKKLKRLASGTGYYNNFISCYLTLLYIHVSKYQGKFSKLYMILSAYKNKKLTKRAACTVKWKSPWNVSTAGADDPPRI